VVPSAPELKTVIEFSHRLTSALAGILVIILLVWAIRLWRRNRDKLTSQVLKTSVAAFVFILIEGALGAGLVLTGNTAETLTPARPFWMGAHLINTLILLTLLTMTAWSASSGRLIRLRGSLAQGKWIMAGVVLIFAVGVTGSIAALTHMIFPSGTITEGIAKDFSPTSHTLLRLRVLHPIVSVATALGLRQGEALGLRWHDVDFDAGTLSVRQALERSGGDGVARRPLAVERKEPQTHCGYA
jgi:cytochrome c oxidase assembly protein subunit 15